MSTLRPLERKSLTLVPYEPEHDESTVAWLNQPDIRESFGLTYRLSVPAHRSWVEQSPDRSIWAIGLRGGEHHIGNVLLHPNHRHHSTYLEMYIGSPDQRGQGHGRSALDAAIAIAFESLGAHRIWLNTLPENQAAAALYQRAGFIMEGTERESIWRNERWESQIRWSLLVDEWSDLRKETDP